ncbi:CrcB family protein [Paracoccaceae bacterium]|nr:CrcB family protein [Paracoccaceae bacterium]
MSQSRTDGTAARHINKHHGASVSSADGMSSHTPRNTTYHRADTPDCSARKLIEKFAMTGVLEGFTTFSALSLDTFKLIEDGRVIFAGGYILASVILSLAAVFGGVAFVRGVWG